MSTAGSQEQAVVETETRMTAAVVGEAVGPCRRKRNTGPVPGPAAAAIAVECTAAVVDAVVGVGLGTVVPAADPAAKGGRLGGDWASSFGITAW